MGSTHCVCGVTGVYMEYGIGLWSYIHARCRMSIAAGLHIIDLSIDLIKIQNSAFVGLPEAYPPGLHDMLDFKSLGYEHPTRTIQGETYAILISYTYYSRLKIPLFYLGLNQGSIIL